MMSLYLNYFAKTYFVKVIIVGSVFRTNFLFSVLILSFSFTIEKSYGEH